MPYTLLPAEAEETGLFFRSEGETAERRGAIGYMRADFGRSGKEFYSAWFDNEAHLKSYAFKREFGEIVDSLRDDGKKPPLSSRDNLKAFCRANPGCDVSGRGDGYKVATLDFSYCFRCLPSRGDYDIYCFAYDNRYLPAELAGEHELPLECLTLSPSTNEIVYIMRDDICSKPFAGSSKDPAVNRLKVDEQNRKWGVTRRQEAAMLGGALTGWDTPAAKPWNYDKNGAFRQTPHKAKDEPAR
jgi:hypothetical protein